MKPYESLGPEVRVADAENQEVLKPTNVIAFNLDKDPFTDDDLEAIKQTVGIRAKFVVIGTNTALKETENEAMIVFFSGSGTTHEEVWAHMCDLVPGKHHVKDAGLFMLEGKTGSLYGNSYSLTDELSDDPTIQTKWRNFYFPKYSGLKIGSHLV